MAYPIYILSSNYEGFGDVLVEALACGCPAVSTDCPSGPSEILADGRYGHLVPVGDAEALAEAILDVLHGNGRRVEPAWLEQFTLAVAVDRYLEVMKVRKADAGEPFPLRTGLA